MYAFSKDERFKDPTKKHSTCFGYEIPGQFGHLKGSGGGRAFGTSQDRFGYENVRFKKKAGRIDGPGDRDRMAGLFSKTSYSFGVSRSDMKKIHVDEILKRREENLPGPGNYEHKRHISAADTIKYSMRQKHFDYKGK